MAVRICTLGVPLFVHGGLEVGQRWQTLEKLDEKQRGTLRDFHGRFIQVHAEDVEKLGEFGLAFQDAGEKLVDAPKKKGEAPKPADTKTTNDAPKGDGKKG